MTISTPVTRVTNILKNAGYRELEVPFSIASIPFNFAAALVGTDKNPDLIVVIDTVQDADIRARQKIDSLGRALDVVKSRRPVTAILTGPRPSDSVIEGMGRVCRVLPIGTPTGDSADQYIQDWLAVLLPLTLPDTNKTVADTDFELISA